MHDLRCVTSPLCRAHIWPIVNTMSAQKQPAYLATSQREGSSSPSAFARVHVSIADHLFGALGMKLV